MGIPQGSILGPLLFSLFINDLLPIFAVSCPLYADDAVLYVPAKTPELAADPLCTSLVEVRQWLNKNQLVLNLLKTVSLCFSIKKNLEQSFHVNLHN